MASANRTSAWTILAFIPGGLGAVLSIIAYTTHYWIQSFTERRTGVDSMGLWEVCFGQDFAAPWHVNDELGRRYADCNWLLSYELRTLQKWLFSDWFIIVEVMITGAIVLQLLGLIFGLVYVVRGCALTRERYVLLTAAICEFSAALFIATGTLVYAYFSGIDQYWLPSPESNHLSWSYGLAVVGGLAAIVAATFRMIDFFRLKMVFDLQTRAKTYAPSLSNRY